MSVQTESAPQAVPKYTYKMVYVTKTDSEKNPAFVGDRQGLCDTINANARDGWRLVSQERETGGGFWLTLEKPLTPAVWGESKFGEATFQAAPANTVGQAVVGQATVG